VVEDLGIIPTPGDWLIALGNPTAIKPWMTRGVNLRSNPDENSIKTEPV
jgi:hypothetical protein